MLRILVGPVDLVDQQDRAVVAPNGGEQRAFEQEPRGEDVALHGAGVGTGPHARGSPAADVDSSTRKVP